MIILNRYINPMQAIANGFYFSMQYIIDFATFRKQLAEIQSLKLQLFDATNKYFTYQQNRDFSTELLKAYRNNEFLRQGSIIELLYSTQNNTIHETFFETPNTNIKINSIISNNDCVLGRVYKQDDKYSYVILYTDSKFRLPAYTHKSRVFGMIYGGHTLEFKSFNSSQDDKIQTGEKLIIAQTDGTLAAGIPFGTIENIKTKTVTNKCLQYYKYGIAL